MATSEHWEPHDVPFAHWTVEELGLCNPAVIATEAERSRRESPDKWVHYNNDCERHKWACHDLDALGPYVRSLFELLTHRTFVGELSAVTDVRGLAADPSLHGAGVHVVEPGGWLNPHLDYALHPKFPGIERRVNLIYFMTGGEGGAFELYDDEGREVKATVQPSPGRAVIWRPGDVEYHGTGIVPEDAGPRVAVCIYYLAPARKNVTRKRALFVPHRAA